MCSLEVLHLLGDGDDVGVGVIDLAVVFGRRQVQVA